MAASFPSAKTLLSIGALASTALAHGTTSGWVTDGTYNQGFKLDYYYAKANKQPSPAVMAWSAENLDNGFVAPDAFATEAINCHIKAAPGALTGSVRAGGTVAMQWTDWPHGIGPVLTYVAACPSSDAGGCAAATATALRWVKIDEAGYDVASSTWAAQRLIDANDTWTTTVPAALRPGAYVFRHEIIALHGAGAANGAQSYPQCANIDVTGDAGTGELPDGTLGSNLYRAEDPGILFDPYGTITSYTIPGPALFGSSGSGSGSGSAPVGTTSTAAAPITTSSAAGPVPVTSSRIGITATSSATAAPPATTTAPADGEDGDEDDCEADEDPTGTQLPSAGPTTPPIATTFITRTSSPVAAPTPTGGSDNVVALYGRCGGIGYTGSTNCGEGVCQVQNDYYSQCVVA